MLRDYKTYLEDIADAAAAIRKFTAGITKDDLVADRKTRDAVVRNLEVIGEAVKKLPEAQRSRYPDVAWRRIAGLRDILIHDYFGIDMDIIWEVIQTKLPVLARRVREMLDE
ncbi:MAG: DUF86 domain-containing protein [candidate division WOR-3 bacterium]